TEPTPTPTPVVAWPISAHTLPALHAQAHTLHTHLTNHPAPPTDIAHTLTTTRTTFDHRAVIIGTHTTELLDGLHALAHHQPAPHLITNTTRPTGKTAFVYPGQGAQWPAMASDLYPTNDVFTHHINACAEALAPHTDWNLIDVLTQQPHAPSLDRVDVVQPALWALMIALTRLWQHHGIHPDAVIGHSQGEIAAAHIAGALTLHDSATIIALRSQAITTLPHHGAMATIALPHTQLHHDLTPYPDLHIAAINSPTSTVIAGDTTQLDTLLHHYRTHNIQVRKLPVTYASHTPHVEPLKNHLITTLATINPQPATIPFYSTVTTTPLDTTHLTPDYWYTNLRQPVQLHPTITTLLHHGHTTYIEPSPHPTLTTALTDITHTTTHPTTITGTLRRDHHNPTTFLTNLAHLHTTGHPTTWPTTTNPHTINLPTYPFQHHHYWLNPQSQRPLLEPAIDLPDGRTEFVGKISIRTHPWLADHAVEETVLVPGAAIAEMALQAAAHGPATTVGELTLHTPLFPPEHGEADLRLSVDPVDGSGARTFSVHARTDGDPAWTTHASGVLTPTVPSPPAGGAGIPADASPLPVDDLYEQLADAGYRYGPSFRGLQAAWRHGDDVYAEVVLPAPAEPDGYGIHPALLDAALQTVFLTGGTDELRLPFAWRDVTLTAGGADRLVVHARVSGPDTLSLTLTDRAGQPVATIGAVTTRPLPEGSVDRGRAAVARSLLGPGWEPAAPVGAPAGRLAVLGGGAVEALRAAGHTVDGYDDLPALHDAVSRGAPAPDIAVVTVVPDDAEVMPGRVHEVTVRTLRLLREWLTDDGLTDARLAIVTRAAVATADGRHPDPAAAAVWGLVRSAQTENPGRFLLVDCAGEADEVLVALATGEDQVAVRDGTPHVLRLRRIAAVDDTPPRTFDPDRTVLVTGGTGTLGRLVARHLAAEHGVRHLLLASRRGAAAAGFVELTEDVRALGAEVTAVACDIGDRDAVRDLLASVPADRPLGAIVHAAGALADGLVTGLSDEQVGAVFRPKVDAAWHLHELTRDVPLDAFVLFSSIAGTIGTPGQANYAAANAFLDALAGHRRAAGLPATSLAWGLWAPGSGLTGDLDRADLARLRRIGLVALPPDRGLRLFDLALTAPDAVLVPAQLDLARLRADAEAGLLPPPLRGLLPATASPRRRAATGGETSDGAAPLATRLAGLPVAEREQSVIAAVRELTGTVLGHGGDDVDETKPFKMLGFDSLTAVELRNRLSAITGLRLPATIVFDHPSPMILGRQVHSLLFPDAEPSGPELLDDLERLESALSALSPDEVMTVAGDDATLDKITGRMRRLLVRWDELRGTPATSTEQITSASDNELFALLDRRLGNGSE
ncbi:SDR family NAD(P)-dependent oxidoreductase, partial [Micromonospora sp. RP3T]|uniref:type I polyketide synthase n=1 Tax=Micromonospora sp. RP3T TaxID=2135446 RepID=UPI000D452BDA